MVDFSDQEELQFNPSPRQWEAWQKLAVDHDSELLYGGAKGGGKSYLGCVWCYAKCLEIIEKCKIDRPREHPIPVGFMGRKIAKDFTDTTLETWKKFIPPKMYEIKGKPAEIIVARKVKLMTGGLDRSEDINKFNSAEFFFFFIDQAEETNKDDISVLRGSLRGQINGIHIPYKGLFTANPAQCWLKRDFLLDRNPNRLFVRALPSDNPYLPDGYISTLKEAFSHRPEMLEAYLNGSWDLTEDADQIIKGRWIEGANLVNIVQFKPDTRKALTCDVSRFGDDETVIYFMEDTDIKEEWIFGKRDTMYTANRLHVLALEHNNCPIIVDEGGLGGGVVDRLREMDNEVIAANNSESKTGEINEKYANRRAEVWDYAARQFSEGAVELHHSDPELKSQLCVPKYKYKNGKIYVESKEDIKKRMLRSPDRADAYVNGLFYMRNLPETNDIGYYEKQKPGRGVYVPHYIKVGG